MVDLMIWQNFDYNYENKWFGMMFIFQIEKDEFKEDFLNIRTPLIKKQYPNVSLK